MLAPADAPARAPMVPRRYRVVRNRRETPDTVTLALEPLDGEPLSFLPGQFNMLYAFGVGEVPISISGHPAEDGPLVHTVRAVGAVSRALCAARPGVTLGVRGPYGTDWDVGGAAGRDVVILAGGIGLAPLRPVVYEILAKRPQFGQVSLLVGARSPDLLLFTKELAGWRGRFDLHVRVTVDHADSSWLGHVGVVPDLLRGAPFDPGNTVAFVCGPEVMMRVSAAALIDLGVPPKAVRLSMERNMKCGIGHCGHCQFGPAFVCREGAVFSFDRAAPLMAVREL
jgi:NAD(P)H-flavin reductase